MRVFVAGATGAIGKQLVPLLVAADHDVHGMTRSTSKRAMVEKLGAVPVVADALDADQVAEAVARARPDVIVHQLTAIPETIDMRGPQAQVPDGRRPVAACGSSSTSPTPRTRLDGEQQLVGVCALEIAGDQITSISGIVNPDKLRHLGPVGDFKSLLAARSP